MDYVAAILLIILLIVTLLSNMYAGNAIYRLFHNTIRCIKAPGRLPWCGNTDNEAEYCGICGKDKDGLVKT